jgi:hypothetical protein
MKESEGINLIGAAGRRGSLRNKMKEPEGRDLIGAAGRLGRFSKKET